MLLTVGVAGEGEKRGHVIEPGGAEALDRASRCCGERPIRAAASFWVIPASVRSRSSSNAIQRFSTAGLDDVATLLTFSRDPHGEQHAPRIPSLKRGIRVILTM